MPPERSPQATLPAAAPAATPATKPATNPATKPATKPATNPASGPATTAPERSTESHDDAEADRPPPSRPVRILVVDDEPLMGAAMTRLLSGREVVALTSARTAMNRILAGERFDVILCDVMMPDFSGIDLYKGIARDAPVLLDRVVFVTGGAYTPDAIDFLEGVPNPRLEKPILPEDLNELVASIWKAARG